MKSVQKKILSYCCLIFSFIQSETQKIANGHPELWNRPYNEIAFITAHNATSISNPPTIINLVGDQDADVEQQLKDGIRAMKVPVHWDYDNYTAHYSDLLQAFVDDVQQKITTRTQEVRKKIIAAQKEVESWQTKINALRKKMQQENAWWATLSTKQKTLNSAKYSTDIAALKTEEQAIILGKKAASQALSAANTAFEAFKQSDPIIAALTINLTTANTILSFFLEKKYLSVKNSLRMPWSNKKTSI